MLKRGIDMLMLALLVDQVIHVSGKLTIIRRKSMYYKSEDYDRFLYQDVKEAKCISEDDGGALVFTKYSDYEHKLIKPDSRGFHNTCKFIDTYMICEMNDDKGCLESWDRENWKLTHSMDTPMGPVFDRRWEAFTEYELGTYNISLYNMSKIVVPFSVRARSDVNILICKNEYKTNLCYWIIIGGWENTRSVIRKCPTGVPPIGKYPEDNSECIEHAHINHKALSQYEWRTFILMWNSVIRNISLYDPDQLIMSYEDKEDHENSNIFHGISFSSLHTPSFIRYHNYTFFFTKTHKSLLWSPTLHAENRTMRLQLLIGLCALCDATISLVDFVTSNKISSVVVNGTSTAHGLPTWQSVKISKDSLEFSYVKLEISLISRSPLLISDPLWAIANVRVHPPKGCLRVTKSVFYNEMRPHLMMCQKLFYQEQSVMDFLSKAELNVELDDANCDLGYIGPNCAVRCKKMLDGQRNCKGFEICNENGCICSPGFQGFNCDEACDKGFYGYGCKKRCGSCLQDKPCDPIGTCPTGCKNEANYTYVPPLCQIGIGKLAEPVIVFTNQTTITVSVPIKWEKEYKNEKLFYSFYIETLDGRFAHQEEWKQIFENTIQLIEIFKYLKPDTFYQIKWNLVIAQLKISSDWKTVETNCNLPHTPRNFTYSFEAKDTVDLEWRHPWKTCGLDLCCFRITIQEISSNLRNNVSRSSKYEILEDLITHNRSSYTKRLYLLPSTLYNISIQTVTIRNETGNADSVKFQTPSSIDLDGEVKIETQKNVDSVIKLRIPKVLNDTRDSVTHIIVIGPNICEQNAKLPKHLLAHLGKEDMKHIWQIVEHPTAELADEIFDMNNYSAKCSVKNGDLCKIVIIITESDLPSEWILFTDEISFYIGGPPPTYYEVWFICIILVLVALSAIFYYNKKFLFYLRAVIPQFIVYLIIPVQVYGL